MLDRREMLAAGLSAAALPAASFAAPGDTATPLWPGRPPGAPATLPAPKRALKRSEIELAGVATPTIQAWRPARSNGIALLVIPGGGYAIEAYTREGTLVAARLASLGYTAFVLTYRLPAEGWRDRADVPLQDAQRAMRLIRAEAPRLGVDPRRVGVIGFSAGGHLAATLATGFDERVYRAVDARDEHSARPAFAGLMYAVTTLEPPETHSGSREHLLAKDASPVEIARRSPLLHIGAQTPPCFLVHAYDDETVPISCSTRWAHAAHKAGVPVEAHLLERGGHGFGVGLPDSNPGALWPLLFDRWVRQTMEG